MAGGRYAINAPLHGPDDLVYVVYELIEPLGHLPKLVLAVHLKAVRKVPLALCDVLEHLHGLVHSPDNNNPGKDNKDGRQDCDSKERANCNSVKAFPYALVHQFM